MLRIGSRYKCRHPRPGAPGARPNCRRHPENRSDSSPFSTHTTCMLAVCPGTLTDRTPDARSWSPSTISSWPERCNGSQFRGNSVPLCVRWGRSPRPSRGAGSDSGHWGRWGRSRSPGPRDRSSAYCRPQWSACRWVSSTMSTSSGPKPTGACPLPAACCCHPYRTDADTRC